mmetsp:Transcript_16474/g.45961  ORF Transcript_16474/g.45961 Transcript_16474/m.45961 type:complete len:1120 (+) Transcript_16474:427-3786(+)
MDFSHEGIVGASAHNGWVESYLNALLSSGLSAEYSADVKKEVEDEGHRSMVSKYYVNQIMNEDEGGLLHAWRKASNSAHSWDYDPRMEHLVWRVWHMKRRRELMQAEAVEEEEADEEMSTDGDAELDSADSKVVVHIAPPEVVDPEALKGKLRLELQSEPAPSSPAEVELPEEPQVMALVDPESKLLPEPPLSEFQEQLQKRFVGLYIVLVSAHGLVRGDRMELGKDPDTGGQVKYVVELAKALSQIEPVYRVDLITRLVDDPKVDASYAQPEERLAPGKGDMGGAFIVRLPFGPRKQYLQKEALWPHLREMADRGIVHIKSTLAALNKDHPCELYGIHGHYADAGDAVAMMCASLEVDMVFTGHSLGRNKLDHLLKSGTMTRAEIDKTYNILRRIEGEERALDSAAMVITSTQEEIDKQWSLYHGYNTSMEKALRYKKFVSRAVPNMVVIPPGLDFSNNQWVPDSVKAFSQPLEQLLEGGSTVPPSSPLHDYNHPASASPTAADALEEPRPLFWPQVFRFLSNPHKPAILAMSRPDAKKNIFTLVQAFGENPLLREICNLVLIMGNRDDIDSMSKGSTTILTTVLKMIDKYDLYGSVAYPKHHQQSDISDIYHLPFATRGVFTNVAWQEPFGLTLIEAAAHGVPIVATKHGGPNDIIATLKNGVLVDPGDHHEISAACLKIVTNSETWETLSSNGLVNIQAYCWPAHCRTFLANLEKSKWQRDLRNGKINARHLPDKTPGMSKAGSAQLDHILLEQSQAHLPGNEDFDRPASQPQLFVAPHGIAANDSYSSLASASLSGVEVRGATYRMAASSPGFITAVFIDCEGGMALVKQVAASCSAAGEFSLVVATFLSKAAAVAALEGVSLARGAVHSLVTRGGAEIWHWNAQRNDYECDEDYERSIQFRWDAQTALRGLNFLKAKAKDTRSVSGRSRGRWMEMLRNWAGIEEANKKPLDGGINDHHSHLVFPLVVEGNATDPIIDIRGKLRGKGIRVNLTLSYDSSSAGAVHVTPLRASRTLAVRYLLLRMGLGFSQLRQVVGVEAVVEEGSLLLGRSSDLLDSLGGAAPVLAAPLATAKGSGTVPQELLFEAETKYFGERVTVVAEPQELPEKLIGFLALP